MVKKSPPVAARAYDGPEGAAWPMANSHPWTRSDWANRWFAGSLAAAAGVAAVDLAVAGDLVLIGLLVLPPLIAAIGSGVRGTAAVGGLCVALALVLGAFDETFGSREHIIAAGAVAAVAVFLAVLRAVC